MPISEEQLTALIGYVDERVVTDGCDHTTRFAELWAERNPVDWARLGAGLAEFGGYCDCEIVMNCAPEDVFR
ncbi:DUF2695 domain-containing protein [Micromonospora sp. PLK6-60]|nr:DUF2695 domain-containing protein [Micromonospora sp. PLK6-60]